MIADFKTDDTVIKTDRLVLRAWRLTDAEDFFEYARVPGVGENAGWLPHKTIQDSIFVLNMFIDENCTFAITLKDTGKVIGSVGLHPLRESVSYPKELRGRELGYALSKEYWGRGIATEAAKGVIDHAFANENIDFLICGHFNGNDRSRRVIEKCGFSYLGETVYDAKMLDKKIPSKEYILLKSAYTATTDESASG